MRISRNRAGLAISAPPNSIRASNSLSPVMIKSASPSTAQAKNISSKGSATAQATLTYPVTSIPNTETVSIRSGIRFGDSANLAFSQALLVIRGLLQSAEIQLVVCNSASKLGRSFFQDSYINRVEASIIKSQPFVGDD